MTCEDLFSDDPKINQYLEYQDRAGKIIKELEKLSKEERYNFPISENFDWWEFWSGDPVSGAKSVEPKRDMWFDAILHILYMQNTRDYLGFGIRYNSGYRTPVWNKIWKGKKNSNHLFCKAGDMYPLGKITIHKFAMIISITTIFDGFGVYNGWSKWVHCDFGRVKPLLYKW